MIFYIDENFAVWQTLDDKDIEDFYTIYYKEHYTHEKANLGFSNKPSCFVQNLDVD